MPLHDQRSTRPADEAPAGHGPGGGGRSAGDEAVTLRRRRAEVRAAEVDDPARRLQRTPAPRREVPSGGHGRRALPRRTTVGAGRRLGLPAGLAVVLFASAYLAGTALAGSGPEGATTVRPGTAAAVDSKGVVQDGEVSATFGLHDRPTGGGVYLAVHARGDGRASGYRARLRVLSDGSTRVGLSKLQRGSETVIGSVPVAGLRVQAPATVRVQVSVKGSGTVQLAARAWKVGEAVPAWQFRAADRSAPVTKAGAVRAWAYLSSAATQPVRVSITDLGARGPADQVPSPTLTPSAPPASPDPTTTPSSTSTLVPPTSTSVRPPEPAPTSSTTPPSKPTKTSQDPGRPGVPAGTRLTVHRGDLVLTEPGRTYDALDVHGFVVVKASNVTIKRSVIRGGVASSDRGLVTNTTDSAKNFVIEDSELVPSHPSAFIDGIKGGNFTARRVDISGTVDSVKIHGSNVRVEDSWLHDNSWFARDANQGNGPTHNDGVQVLAGDDITIVGNDISGAANAGLQVTQDVGPVTGLTFSGNRVDGGNCSIKLQHRSKGTLGPVVISDNTFGGNTSIKGCAIVRTSSTTISGGGNVWKATRGAVDVKVHG